MPSKRKSGKKRWSKGEKHSARRIRRKKLSERDNRKIRIHMILWVKALQMKS